MITEFFHRFNQSLPSLLSPAMIPNVLSFLRIPLGLFFFQDNIQLRAIALTLAMITDGLDGYLARNYFKTSRIGTFLDPFADKFFVICALLVFLQEGKLHAWELCAMLCRDFAVLLFGCYLYFKNTLKKYQFRAIRCGKITTALQFFVLFALIFNISMPSSLYFCFVILGIAALVELYLERKKLKAE